MKISNVESRVINCQENCVVRLLNFGACWLLFRSRTFPKFEYGFRLFSTHMPLMAPRESIAIMPLVSSSSARSANLPYSFVYMHILGPLPAFRSKASHLALKRGRATPCPIGSLCGLNIPHYAFFNSRQDRIPPGAMMRPSGVHRASAQGNQRDPMARPALGWRTSFRCAQGLERSFRSCGRPILCGYRHEYVPALSPCFCRESQREHASSCRQAKPARLRLSMMPLPGLSRPLSGSVFSPLSLKTDSVTFRLVLSPSATNDQILFFFEGVTRKKLITEKESASFVARIAD